MMIWNKKLLVVIVTICIAFTFAAPNKKDDASTDTSISDEEKPIVNGPDKEMALPATVTANEVMQPKPDEEVQSKPDEVEQLKPESSEEPAIGAPASFVPTRRLVTYDQRQEGKYNIRADLDNFMIVVIPSSPSSGASLLDLLTRSNQKKSNNHGKYSSHKKYHGHTNKHHDDEMRNEIKFDLLQGHAAAVAEQNARHQQQQFIEGRTPYHVDISSSNEVPQPSSINSRLLEALLRRRLYGRSNSPVYRLPSSSSDDVEQKIAADPIPSVVSIKGNKNKRHIIAKNPLLGLDGFGVGGGGGGEVVVVADVKNEQKQMRNSKSLIDSNYNNPNINHNSVIILTSIETNDNDDDYNIESNRGFVDLTDTSNSFDSLNVDNIDRLAADSTKTGDGWDELTLIGAQEQCGPDRRRDSYGICQFVPL